MKAEKKSQPEKKVDPDVSEAISRAMEFIDAHGIQEVAERIGVSSASIYMVKSGTSGSFKFSTLLKLAQVYPDFDLGYVFSGHRRGTASNLAAPVISDNRRLKELEEENRALKALLEATRETKDAYKALAQKQTPGSVNFLRVHKLTTGKRLMIKGMTYRDAAQLNVPFRSFSRRS